AIYHNRPRSTTPRSTMLTKMSDAADHRVTEIESVRSLFAREDFIGASQHFLGGIVVALCSTSSERFEGGRWRSPTTCRSGADAALCPRGAATPANHSTEIYWFAGGGGGHVFRIEMSNPLAPHSDERPRCQLIHRFPRVFDRRKGIPPNRAFA